MLYVGSIINSNRCIVNANKISMSHTFKIKTAVIKVVVPFQKPKTVTGTKNVHFNFMTKNISLFTLNKLPIRIHHYKFIDNSAFYKHHFKIMGIGIKNSVITYST